jgi:hypothetical protein
MPVSTTTRIERRDFANRIQNEGLNSGLLCNAAFSGFYDLLQLAQKRYEKEGFEDRIWADGESVRIDGLIQLGDALLSVTEYLDALEAQEREIITEVHDLLKGKFQKLMEKTTDKFLEACKNDVNNKDFQFVFSGKPYMTKGQYDFKYYQQYGTQTPETDPELTIATVSGYRCAQAQ